MKNEFINDIAQAIAINKAYIKSAEIVCDQQNYTDITLKKLMEISVAEQFQNASNPDVIQVWYDDFLVKANNGAIGWGKVFLQDLVEAFVRGDHDFKFKFNHESDFRENFSDFLSKFERKSRMFVEHIKEEKLFYAYLVHANNLIHNAQFKEVIDFQESGCNLTYHLKVVCHDGKRYELFQNSKLGDIVGTYLINFFTLPPDVHMDMTISGYIKKNTSLLKQFSLKDRIEEIRQEILAKRDEYKKEADFVSKRT